MWEVLERSVLHDGWPWVRLSREHVRLPNGVEIPDFYHVEIPPYTMIFAVRDDGYVAMVEHYKHGPACISLELPAGYIEEGEDPLISAQRELREETGLISQNWQSLGRQFIDGNRGCGWVNAFLARDASVAGVPQLEHTELMTVHFKPIEEVYQLWRTGVILNVAAHSIVGRSLVELGFFNGR
jgi:ADP-ribose pyrophosphatase